MGAGGGLALMLSLAMAGEGGAGMLPSGPRGAGTALLAAADLLRPSFFLEGRLMLTLIVSPCFSARSSFSGGASFSCSICSST